MKRAGGSDAIDFLAVGGITAILTYSAIITQDSAVRLLCIAVFLFYLSSRRRAKTLKAQLIEIVDERGDTRACIGYAACGLSIGVNKDELQNNAFTPLELFDRASYVQFTFGANLGSSHSAYDKTAFIQIIDSARDKSFRVGLQYPQGKPAEAERVYCQEDVA